LDSLVAEPIKSVVVVVVMVMVMVVKVAMLDTSWRVYLWVNL